MTSLVGACGTAEPVDQSPGMVPVVYSKKYKISLLGLEKLHPFDIAIRQLQKEKKIRRALIIDTDAHQGNGTIVCLPNDPDTFTFSMHEAGIYPMPKEKGDWDIALPAGTGDASCLGTLERSLPEMFRRSRPDIVFHVAGCDMLAGDPLANLRMTHEGIAKRDAMVAAYCKQKNVPYVMTMAGGYSKEAWKAQYGGIVEVMKVFGK